MPEHVEVALPLPLFRTFTYRIDEGPPPEPGCRVLVPFRRRERVGWVLGPADPAGIRGIRSVHDRLETEPSVTPELLELARWMAEYYVCPVGIVLRSLLPSVLSDVARERVTLTPAGRTLIEGRRAALQPPGPELPDSAWTLLEALESMEGPAALSTLRKHLGGSSAWPPLRRLSAEGLVEHHTEPPRAPPVRTRRVVRLTERVPDLLEREELFGRADRQRECYEYLETAEGAAELAELTGRLGFSRSVISGLEDKALVTLADEEVLRDPFQGREPAGPPPVLTPNPAQRLAIDTLTGALDDDARAPFLLHGVTGSGKTLVYIELLREVVDRRGRSAIVLVPEIALTPQTVGRFRAWFGDRVAVLHSALSNGERYDEWRQLRSGDKRIVVGARSALFAPLDDLGAIIVDEEHEGTYKQSEAPRYHARDLAVLRAHRAGAVCVLGSATPSLESWRNAERGKFRRLTLPDRATGALLPKVDVVDLRKLRAPGGQSGQGSARASSYVLTPPLTAALTETLKRGEQAILLLNRRGYSSFLQCRGCGEVMECPHCSVSLTYHRGRQILLCHHCRHEVRAPNRCPSCGDPELSRRGMGTEQVEQVVGEAFPGARIARMDVDTTGGKWAHADILGRVGRGEVDILLGTQMIAKGLDFPMVTLVGVVNADVGLHLPDFRASERAFQLLSQVAGRAGRGERGGRVIIQSSLPEHYAVQSALTHDFEGFARAEFAERREPAYPPHLRMANVIVSSPDAELAASTAEGAAAWLRARIAGPDGAGAGLTLVGPAPSPIERLHTRWRWHFFLRGAGVAEMTRLLHAFMTGYDPPAGDVRIALDRDPVALL